MPVRAQLHRRGAVSIPSGTGPMRSGWYLHPPRKSVLQSFFSFPSPQHYNFDNPQEDQEGGERTHDHVRCPRGTEHLCFCRVEGGHSFANHPNNEHCFCKERDCRQCAFHQLNHREGTGRRCVYCCTGKQGDCCRQGDKPVLVRCILHVRTFYRGNNADIGNPDHCGKQGKIEDIPGHHCTHRCKSAGDCHETPEPHFGEADILCTVGIATECDIHLFFRTADDDKDREGQRKEKERDCVRCEVHQFIAKLENIEGDTSNVRHRSHPSGNQAGTSLPTTVVRVPQHHPEERYAGAAAGT